MGGGGVTVNCQLYILVGSGVKKNPSPGFLPDTCRTDIPRFLGQGISKYNPPLNSNIPITLTNL